MKGSVYLRTACAHRCVLHMKLGMASAYSRALTSRHSRRECVCLLSKKVDTVTHCCLSRPACAATQLCSYPQQHIPLTQAHFLPSTRSEILRSYLLHFSLFRPHLLLPFTRRYYNHTSSLLSDHTSCLSHADTAVTTPWLPVDAQVAPAQLV